jgi:HEAT repeat protein
MTPPVSISTAGLLGALVFGAFVAGAVLLARIAQRRERRERRAGALALRRALRDVARGRLEPRALAQFTGAANREAFWSAIEASSRTSRLPAAIARTLSHTEHVDDERRALRDDSPWRRELAARRLGLVRSKRTRSSLRRAMVRGPEFVTRAAALSLAQHRDLAALRWLLAHPELMRTRTPRARASLLRAFGRGANATLIAALEAGGGGAALERAMLDALDAPAAPHVVATLCRRLTHHDSEVRTAAARALGRTGDRSAASALVAALTDPEWPVRAQAARALGRIGDAGCAPALAACLTDRAWWVRRHAAYALAALGDQGRTELERVAAGSPDRYAREMAIEALEEFRRHAASA